MRKWKLGVDPLCEWCAERGLAVPAEVVHHADKDPWNNRMDNLVSLCRDCHEDHHGRMSSTACDIDGVPLSGKHHWREG